MLILSDEFLGRGGTGADGGDSDSGGGCFLVAVVSLFRADNLYFRKILSCLKTVVANLLHMSSISLSLITFDGSQGLSDGGADAGGEEE